ncbi:MAG: CRISPR-associated RAMP protein [Clostridiales bacterium]|jgi:CRISPR-associated RAMP protein (TIGR02581 family)|nr:CRISPR-associated RAMP protein [Clostridiales bacterium]
MFKKLINEAQLTVRLAAAGPLLICSGETNAINPSLPDMCFVRCKYQGEETVYMPGSSIKGVFRSRYEQLAERFAKSPCDILNHKKSCSGQITFFEKNEKVRINGKLVNIKLSGTDRYRVSCAACRLFGNLSLGSRIQFTDAYPVGDKPVIGTRNGVAIDRATGAARTQKGALFNFEVVESGTFELKITLTNFARYQLALILAILEDIDAGFVSFGMGTSRGNGYMKISNRSDMPMLYRYFGKKIERFCGYDPGDAGKKIELIPQVFAQEYTCSGMNDILAVVGLNSDTLENAINADIWKKLADFRRNRV